MLRKRPLALETLESRLVPDAYGIPWPAAERLSLSFAPDQTPIAGHTSNLFAVLDAIAPTPVWQREILRAFQTWAVHTNVNVGVKADGGQPFGIAGRPARDPRFGDIRIAAQPMSREAVATSIPFSPVFSGTLTGDLFLNSNSDFAGGRLFAAMLHEAGHVLGLGHSDDPASAMYAHLSTRSQLTGSDIAALQALYGVRTADVHEGRLGNDDFRTATPIRHPHRSGHSYDGSTPLVLFGDITARGDVDVFSLRAPNGYRGPLTIRLQTEGISLLAPRLTVYDAAGRELGQAASTESNGSAVSVRLDQVDPAATYFLRVEGAAGDEFGVGAYGLAASYDDVSQVSAEALALFLRGAYEELTPEEIDKLFGDPTHAFIGDDRGNNDFNRAVFLRQKPGAGTVFDVTGSLSHDADADFYRILTAPGRTGRATVLTVTVWGITDNAVVPRIAVFTPSRTPVSAEVLLNGNGTYAIEINGGHPQGFYYLRLSNPTDPGSRVGNFALHALFRDRTADLDTFATGELSETDPAQSHALYVAHSQLFQFVLSAAGGGGIAGAGVRMRVFDSSCTEVFRLEAGAGDTVSGPSVFLAPGAYTVTFTALGPPPIPNLSYRLRGKGLGDPIGPALEDPTLRPMYESPFDPLLFIYPGDIHTPSQYLWITLA